MSRIKQFDLPDLGEGLTEGEILKWLVGVGDVIELNQPIVEVETAKAAVEIPAKWGGRVQAIFHPEGATVEVGTAIIAIDTEPAAGPAAEPTGPAPSRPEPPQPEIPPTSGAIEPGMIGGPAPGGRTAVLVGYGPRTTAAKRRPRRTTGEPTQPAEVASASAGQLTAEPAPAEPVPAGPGPTGPVTKALAKPPVRKLARDLGVDLAGLRGSGPLGSVTRVDVLRAGEARNGSAQTGPAVPLSASDREQRIPVRGVRRLTAENMVASAFTAPHVTEFLTVDLTRSVKALDRIRSQPDWQGIKVSPLLMVARAMLLAARRHPMVNSTWAGDEIVVKEYVNLGIAAATERGLIVPNIKDAGRLTTRELAEAMADLVRTAKAGRTAPADMAGGTMTVTNVGVFGVDSGTPILPPGESAILAIGTIRKAPWVHKEKIRIRQVATLALSFDHRIIDGALGSAFLRDVGAFLTDPEAALLAWT
ncbi:MULTISPECIES: dihydrolipoamide acetyltransferase family protein [unclassified Solwaraspora]|uniref:dihydrolipoamide acetyltransferase family protein n=1 Tax=unclassified Solwaraspora TaxID=2627926 RepID=UPI00248D3859|nr:MULTISPECIES: dihydrolipoamide acetyltransferase family protein [unclassified Solwaraspora]WBB96955.1 dihydrolipoamide acetyltransferase family protein [Solwaraspora sp. WMMA2059]WBC19141.1 dihydrolipoamide acetyltransferase family protein [Solwaraspora sp. WMMA2080]WJK33444.1 dihydrolipoamide acetyltransferase family protein [Solwaraspora sp. WMMA2065]